MLPSVQKNYLYYGDNLTVLRDHIKDESVDLIYLDPPFNSRQDYNVLFAERDGTRSASQIMAFEDTWEWNMDAEAAYEEVVERGGRVSQAIQAFRTFLGNSDMMAYLAMMAPRLIELHRVLKETGSIYLHCDPTAGHYLKIVLDAIFGPAQFVNEVTWKRSSAHSDTKQGMRRFGRIRDLLLVYTKSEEHVWNPVYTPYTAEYLESEYRHLHSSGRRYKETDATAARPGGDTEYEWRVKRPNAAAQRWVPDLTEEFRKPREEWEYLGVRPYNGRFWGYSKANLEKFWNEGHLIHRKTGMPRIIQFADEMPGIPLQDLWNDIPPASGDENLGYPTQKPEALLERVVKSSSNEGGTVLDPFCGCGTAISVAQRLNRHWIGIDITHLAIGLIKKRLDDAFGVEVRESYEIIGEPADLKGAEELAKQDPYQFQWWALSQVGARPLEKKKGADQGIDGRLYFHDERGGKTKQIILSVKAGKLHATYVRDLRGVVEREKAEIGVLISMEPPTKPMLREATQAGFYRPPGLADKYPRIQILTIEELLAAKKVDYPRFAADATFKKAPKAKKSFEDRQLELNGDELEEPF